MSDAEKLAELEAKVELLTQAMNSLLEWRLSSHRQYPPPLHAIIEGKERTREILARLGAQTAD